LTDSEQIVQEKAGPSCKATSTKGLILKENSQILVAAGVSHVARTLAVIS